MTSRQSDIATLAVLHRAGGAWHGLAADLRSARPRLVDATRLGDSAAVEAWLDRQRADEVLVVLPAAAVACRPCTLPAADDETLLAALALQAEAHVGAGTPEHRVGMAVLDKAAGETSRTGIVLAWPETAAAAVPDCGERPVRFTADIAALAAILNGDRPAEPLLWVDREDGSLALAFTHGNGAAFRATHQDVSGDDWTETVGRVIAETGLAAGHTASFIESAVADARTRLDGRDGAHLLLPHGLVDHVAPRLVGASADEGWWELYGVAAGAVLARAGALAPLTELRATAPVEHPSVFGTIAQRLARPRTAVGVVAACIVVLAFAPLVIAGLRLKVLEWRHDDLDRQLASVKESEKVLALYDELDQQRWTMTKLMADLASSTPLGIELESIRINHGESVTVNGTASPDDRSGESARDVVATMQRLMQESRIFEDITLDWGDSTNFGTYQFVLAAKVARPHRRVLYALEQDFARASLADRLYSGKSLEEIAAAGADAGDGTEPAVTATAGPGARVASNDTTVEHPAAPGNETPPGAAAGADPLARGDFDPYTPDAAREAAAAGTPETPTRPAAGTARPANGPRGAGDLTVRPGGDRGGGGETKSRSEGDSMSEGGRSASQEIPEPLTAAQVDAMSKAEAQEMLAKVGRARTYARKIGDDELHDRLKADWELLLERIKKP